MWPGCAFPIVPRSHLSVKFTDLSPFVSLLLVEGPTSGTAAHIPAVLTDVATRLDHRDAISNVTAVGPERADGGFVVGRITYREERRPAWATTDEPKDIEHHLFLICCRNNKAGFFISDPTLMRQLQRLLDDGTNAPWDGFDKIPRPRLNAAFVRNKTVTLWLSGLHRHTEAKVDNKVITGSNLKFALDPLGDQTYTFSAARSRLQLGRSAERSIGVAPKKSSVWAGPSLDWADFLGQVGALFDAIPARQGKSAPLPCLAVEVDPTKELSTVKDAFDVSFASVEVFEPDLDPTERQQLELWSDVVARVRSASGAKVSADVFWPTDRGREKAGRIDIVLGVTNAELAATLTWTENPSADPVTREEAKRLVEALRTRRDLLKMWFDSGHVLGGGALHRMQYREFPFTGFEWVDFSGYDVTKEKPKPLATRNIGAQDSLFCWVLKAWKPDGQRRWRGWLACTDGSMEMADFIHLATDGAVPEITFIHAKGATSDQPARGISVSAYEVVVSQAVKNLRHLDSEILAGRFLDKIDARIADAVWHNGRLGNRQAMLDAIRTAGNRFRRRVVILQPHARKSLITAPAPGNARADTRAAQLHTLLLAGQVNCRALGADLSVLADER